jgi:hypothetical protein
MTLDERGAACQVERTMADASVPTADRPRRHLTLSPRFTALGAAVLLLIVAALSAWGGYAYQQRFTTAANDRAAASQRSADERKAALQQDYDARVTALSTRASELDSREASLKSRAAELDQRQQDLDARTAALKATSFADGVWVVGTDIQPGTYRAAQATSDCYWAKLQTDDGIIKNDIPGGPTTVTIETSVPKFKSTRCGTWTKIS